MTTPRLHVLFIDNFDSFVFNLVDEFARRDCEVEVWRNDVAVGQALTLVRELAAPALVVLSPGPGTPSRAGCCIELLRSAPLDLPILGVCLGHQAIVEAFGGRVGRAPEVVHGSASLVEHDGKGVFAGLPSPMSVARYHSLVGVEIPASLEVTARLDGMPMAVRHSSRPVAGVQFHPESILTPQGGLLIENIISMAQNQRREETS